MLRGELCKGDSKGVWQSEMLGKANEAMTEGLAQTGRGKQLGKREKDPSPSGGKERCCPIKISSREEAKGKKLLDALQKFRNWALGGDKTLKKGKANTVNVEEKN